MNHTENVMEYKCPCCNASLVFHGENQQLKCDFCENTFDLDTLRACSEEETPNFTEDIQWESGTQRTWNEEDESKIRAFVCDTCAGTLITDENTAATFCPYCGNSAILPGRLSGGLKPEGVIPFKTTKEDAQQAFFNLCKGKPLLPKFFAQEQQLEKITGIYVPFWLYDCNASLRGSYKATRIHTWADSRYTYTKTDHYLLKRQAVAAYAGIPMDGSAKMDDTFMESIEPYDYTELVDFEKPYLSGFLADKYDVDAKLGEPRIRQRVENSMNDHIESTLIGYSSVITTARNIAIDHGKAKYVLLPVWMLNTRYNGKTYTFAMNGQTGKMTGAFPVSPKRAVVWFASIWAASSVLVSLIQLVL